MYTFTKRWPCTGRLAPCRPLGFRFTFFGFWERSRDRPLPNDLSAKYTSLSQSSRPMSRPEYFPPILMAHPTFRKKSFFLFPFLASKRWFVSVHPVDFLSGPQNANVFFYVQAISPAIPPPFVPPWPSVKTAITLSTRFLSDKVWVSSLLFR